ncbi:MAG TPA: DUF4388 domain-containing protein [Pyrinomonadaceae bacterium]|nr:DUF4388 domain-containing protein [Pyrinomonadaceae bacterium]
MALSGQLSDLSLAELIEFFCNQRKTGRLKVAYEATPGYFYFDRGDLVDARVGSLNGIEAIYYALTLANASFKFSPSFEATRRTIHQPWTQVTLEGLRRLDEGIKPRAPEPVTGVLPPEELDEARKDDEAVEYEGEIKTPLSMMVDSAAGGGRGKMVYAGIALAVIALVAVAGIPAGWYKSKPAPAQPVAEAQAPADAQPAAESTEAASEPEQQTEAPASAETAAASTDMNAIAAKRAREARERARQAEAARQAAAGGQPAGPAEAPKKPEAAKPGPRMVTVQVSYDEAGRVTQTSGGDGTAQRIARQKRFPAGKAGTTTVTIPIN